MYTVQNQFDSACEYMEAVQQIDQIGSSSMSNVAQIEQIIQSVDYVTNGNNPQFDALLKTAAGAQMNEIVKNEVTTLISDYQISTANPYNNGASADVPIYFASDRDYEGGDIVTYGAQMTLANFDPNARIGFQIYPTWLPASDGKLAYDSDYAPWMPPPGFDGQYYGNEAEYEMGEDAFWGCSYSPPWGDTVDTGGEGGQWTSLVASYTQAAPPSGVQGVWGTMNVTVTASDFEQFLKITPTASAAGDLAKFENMVG
jgi:hypothetical protein